MYDGSSERGDSKYQLYIVIHQRAPAIFEAAGGTTMQYCTCWDLVKHLIFLRQIPGAF